MCEQSEQGLRIRNEFSAPPSLVPVCQSMEEVSKEGEDINHVSLLQKNVDDITLGLVLHPVSTMLRHRNHTFSDSIETID